MFNSHCINWTALYTLVEETSCPPAFPPSNIGQSMSYSMLPEYSIRDPSYQISDRVTQTPTGLTS